MSERKRYTICYGLSEFIFWLGGSWLLCMTFRWRRRIGWLYWRVTGDTCNWCPHADLNDLIYQLVEQLGQVKSIFALPDPCPG